MIREYLLKYKAITEVVIVNVRNDLELDKYMKEREEILKNIIENKYFNKEEVKKIYIELNLDTLDKKLKEELNYAMEINKEELRKVKRQRSANKAYGKNINIINFFNKKI